MVEDLILKDQVSTCIFGIKPPEQLEIGGAHPKASVGSAAGEPGDHGGPPGSVDPSSPIASDLATKGVLSFWGRELLSLTKRRGSSA